MRRPLLIRGSLVLSLALTAALAVHGWRDGEKAREAERWTARTYDRIEVGMWDYDVESMLGSEGQRMSGPGWPETVGEIPGYEDGIPAARIPWLKNVVGPHCRISPDRRVYWEAWRVPGRHRWIAVAYYGHIVVAKKSGLE